MNNPRISVIVPIYKAEQYLIRCIDSILAQTFTNFELLLIDDGSPDNSIIICDEYATKDNRIRVFHKENGGVSSARNLGLNKAKGEWIAFIDADDSVELNYLECLYDNSQDFDLVICGYKQRGINVVTTKYEPQKIFLNKENDIFNKALDINMCVFYSPWRKLFKTKIINQNKIYFDSSMFLTEDTCFIIHYLNFARNINIIQDTPYIYYLFDASNKYLMDFETYQRHLITFSNKLHHLESYTHKNYNILRSLIYNTFFHKFIIYILKLDKITFVQNIKKLNILWLHDKEYYSNLNWCLLKKNLYRFVLNTPQLGYYVLRFIYKV